MISILLPTRGRPDNIITLHSSLLNTKSGDVEIILYIDHDDNSYPDYILEDLDKSIPNKIIRGPRKTLSSCYQDCYLQSSGDIVMFAGDDLIFRTDGWDEVVREKFEEIPDRIIFVHGDDGVWQANFGTHGFLHRRWCDALGYVVPPYFACDWSDTWVNEVANRLNRRVYIPILIEHMHPNHGKAPEDKTHEERRARDDRGALYNSLAHKREEDIQKLAALIRT